MSRFSEKKYLLILHFIALLFFLFNFDFFLKYHFELSFPVIAKLV